MTVPSKHDIDMRRQYVSEARSLDFLNASFCIYFYNNDVKRWGPPPKPEDISPTEAFANVAHERVDEAIARCQTLIDDGFKLGYLAFDLTPAGRQKFEQERKLYDQRHKDFNDKNRDRAFASGMRDNR